MEKEDFAYGHAFKKSLPIDSSKQFQIPKAAIYKEKKRQKKQHLERAKTEAARDEQIQHGQVTSSMAKTSAKSRVSAFLTQLEN